MEPSISRRSRIALLALILAVQVVALAPPASGQGAAPPLQDELARQLQSEEIRKLREEVIALQRDNRLRESGGAFLYWVSGLSGLIGGAFALLLAVFGNFLTRTFSESQRAKIVTEQRKLEQERELASQRHDLELLKGLGSDNGRLRLASVAVLLERIASIPESAPAERRYLIDALLSVTKEDAPDQRLNKTIGDGILRVLDAICTDCTPVHAQSPLRSVDLQKCFLQDVYWSGADLREVDLFAADLSRASLRNAIMDGAILYAARLQGAVLRGARLPGANLRDADLQGADLTGADLRGADFGGARLDGAVLSGVRTDEMTRGLGA